MISREVRCSDSCKELHHKLINLINFSCNFLLRMSRARAWILSQNGTSGRSFLRKSRASVLSSSHLTGKLKAASLKSSDTMFAWRTQKVTLCKREFNCFMLIVIGATQKVSQWEYHFCGETRPKFFFKINVLWFILLLTLLWLPVAYETIVINNNNP